MESLSVLLVYNKLDEKLFYKTETAGNKIEISNWREFYSGKQRLDIDEIAVDGNALLEGKYEKNKKGNSKFKITAIEYAGTKYERANSVAAKSLPYHEAKAPYNFVPLNDRVISYENNATHERYDENCYSGYITLNIETKTPVFIRGNGNKNLLVDDKPILPGSSIRGMIRNLVEICTWSQMRFFNNRRLFFRSFDSTNLQKRYINIHQGIKAGFLFYRQKEETYYIEEALNFPEKISRVGNDFSIIVKNDEYIVTPGPFTNGNTKSPSWKFVIAYKQNSRFELREEDMERYFADEDRKIGDGVKIDQLAKTDERFLETGVPVFFIVQDTIVQDTGIIFGHTNYFRVPYTHSISQHIPGTGTKQNDLATSIFGIDHEKAGKLDVEDAICMATENLFLLEEKETSLKILNGPKPTTFQHYLKQPKGYKTKKTELKNWDDVNAVIRGFKQYWHRDTSDDPDDPHSWNLGRVETGSVYAKPVIPLNRGIYFNSKIHFSNLSSIELGALLFVIDLPGEQYCHKIGLGKPLGLGSIKIKPQLTIINRDERYRQLFTGDGGFFKSEQSGDMSIHKAKFEKFMQDSLEIQSTGSKNKTIWQTERLGELLSMLNFSHTENQGWNEATRYLKIDHPDNENEYRDRNVLPYPTEVLKQK